MDPSETTPADNNAAASVSTAVEAGNTTAATTATVVAAAVAATTAAAAKGTNNDGTTIEASAASTTTQSAGATATTGINTTTETGTKRVTIAEPTPPINSNATNDPSKQTYIVQLQEGSNELAIQFVQAIETAADIAQSTTTIPDILVINKSFGTIDI